MNVSAPRFRPRATGRRWRPVAPTGGVFVSCTDSWQTLCAYRENASARRVHVLHEGNRTATVDDADDPRVFTHADAHWILNNNFYRPSLIHLWPNGTLGRELRLPWWDTKNVAPLSWNPSAFYLLDLQAGRLWPARLTDAVAVLVGVPLALRVERVLNGQPCVLHPGCIARGGTAGVHLHPLDEHAHGAGHCTLRTRTRMLHAAFWWTLHLPSRTVRLQPLCTSKRPLVDPSALYPLTRRAPTRRSNHTRDEAVWLLATTEADEEWNRRGDQPYYNQRYRGVQLLSERVRPMPTGGGRAPQGAPANARPRFGVVAGVRNAHALFKRVAQRVAQWFSKH